MSKEEAAALLRALVAQYGPRWDVTVPQSAYLQLIEINKVLTTSTDRLAALGSSRGAALAGERRSIAASRTVQPDSGT